MPEGPSIVIVKEKLQLFKGKKVLSVGGYAAIGRKKISGKKLTDIKTWGKHLLLLFGKTTLRVHFMLFGSYAIDPEGNRRSKMTLRFSNGMLEFYLTGLEIIDTPLTEYYDWSTDILHNSWDAKAAAKKIKAKENTLICDCLMDQAIVSGSGNIIKNEVLFRAKVHPMARAGKLPAAVVTRIVNGVRSYAKTFLKEKKAGTLEDHWKAYEQSECPRCAIPLMKKTLGKTKRRCFYCNNCQLRY